jgi:putative transposase
MRFIPSILTSLLEPVDRRRFKAIVDRHGGDAYAKSFSTWEHFVALIFAQLSGSTSLRAIETGFNAGANHHYHLNCGPLARSTLADANARRPAAIFADVFDGLVASLGRKTRREARETLRLIDSTPVPLGHLFDCAASNGRIRGFKLHVLHDPVRSMPLKAHMTPANVNDIAFGRDLQLERGVTYVFDKGYCHFEWWMEIAEAGSFFVTRPKTNMRWKTLRKRALGATQGDGFTVRADREVKLASKGDSKLAVFLRRITVRRDNGDVFDIITNDSVRSAVELASCYKARWQIEIFFKWIKQNLNIRKFIAINENAVRLQILAALIAYALMHIAREKTKTPLSPRRFAELASAFIHARRPMEAIEKPPPDKARPKSAVNTSQLEFGYA